MIGSTFLLIGALILHGLGWKLTIELVGSRIQMKKAVMIWIVSQIMRYLPGKLWMPLCKLYLTQRAGVPRNPTLIGITLEFSYLIASGLTIGACSPLGIKILSHFTSLPYLFWTLPLALLLLPLLAKKVFEAFLYSKDLRLLADIKAGSLIVLFGFFLMLWAVQGIAFYFFANALLTAGSVGVTLSIPVYSLSCVMGTLSFIAPAGLGIREGILTILLSSFIPVSSAASISIATRIWSIGTETICAAFALIGILSFLAGREKRIQGA